MAKQDVVIVRFWGQPPCYLIRRCGRKGERAGWAQFDGGFTPGISPLDEALQSNVVSAPYAGELMEFVLEQGWHLVAVIENEYGPEAPQAAL